MLCPFDYPEFQDATLFIWSVDSVALGMLLFISVVLISRAFYLSPALNPLVTDSSLFVTDRNEITLFDVHTGHLYAQCWDPGWKQRFLEMEQSWRLILTHMQLESTT